MLARISACHAGATGRVEFRVMDADSLALPAKSFDAVWVIECTEHLSDKRRFISSAARRLRSGGVFAVCSWTAGPNNHPKLTAEICRAMLCPSFGTVADYLSWMGECGLTEIRSLDITPRVAPTWTYLARLAVWPNIRIGSRCLGTATLRFVKAFPLMARAYAENTLRYAMFGARRQ